jgi:hypothetical protein
MPVQILTRVSVNANSGAFVQLAAAPTGEIPVILYSYTAYNLVYGVDNATDALAEATANRVLLQNASVNNSMVLDLCKTWVRSNGSASELYMIRQH